MTDAQWTALLALWDDKATSRTAPNRPECSCDPSGEDDEAGEPILCPYHEDKLRPLRWSTLALMVVDYEALVYATHEILRGHK